MEIEIRNADVRKNPREGWPADDSYSKGCCGTRCSEYDRDWESESGRGCLSSRGSGLNCPNAKNITCFADNGQIRVDEGWAGQKDALRLCWLEKEGRQRRKDSTMDDRRKGPRRPHLSDSRGALPPSPRLAVALVAQHSLPPAARATEIVASELARRRHRCQMAGPE